MSTRSSLFSSGVLLLAAVAAGSFLAGRWSAQNAERGRAMPSQRAGVDPHRAAVPEASRATSGSGESSAESDWKRWSSEPRNEVVDRQRASALERMGAANPQRALSLAEAEPNLRFREALRAAALRGWASVAPDAALAAAMRLPGIDNRAAIAAVLGGAAADPQTVARLGRQLTDGTDPVALDYGDLAIGALAEHGHFVEAVRFAGNGPTANQARWLNEAFGAWAREQPQQALAGLREIADPTLRHEALEGLVSGWMESDPGSLADHALHEPAAVDRNVELSQALTSWVMRDPVAAAQWLSEQSQEPGLDTGVAAVASLTPLIASHPEVAADWAVSITEPQLRQSTLRNIGEEWRHHAPTALEAYVQSHSQLSEADRNALLGVE